MRTVVGLVGLAEVTSGAESLVFPVSIVPVLGVTALEFSSAGYTAGGITAVAPVEIIAITTAVFTIPAPRSAVVQVLFGDYILLAFLHGTTCA